MQFALGRKLSGMEWAAGIPGTVGGGVVMNAGTRLGAMRRCVECRRSGDDLWQTETSGCFARSHLPIVRPILAQGHRCGSLGPTNDSAA